ncbi:MAG: Smr/MutS family protein [Candidatus Fimivicinus sp.]|nr:Smr/MutS family protein [Oscillospiraceae bacterium]MDY5590674.1 Smr/MutS family protein [Candidatus Fimivicinus sp.]
MLQVTRQGSQMIVDIHGMHAREARFRLDMLIDNAPEEVKEIIVIHGYSHGQVLKNMVRNELTSTRIKQIRAAYNAGQTVIELRKHRGNR